MTLERLEQIRVSVSALEALGVAETNKELYLRHCKDLLDEVDRLRAALLITQARLTDAWQGGKASEVP